MKLGLQTILGVLAAVIALGTGAPASGEEARLALLIGNSRYEHATPLRNPENDVDLMEASLRTAGFRTIVGKNASLGETNRLIDAFLTAARATPKPVLLVYFAGRGVQLASGKNLLVPTDARTGDAAELGRVALSATELLDRLVAVEPRLAMLVLDACRDNPFETASRSLRRGLAPLGVESDPGRPSNQLIAFATAPGKTADDGDAGNSPYASALAEAIVTPGLSLEAVFRETRRKVVDRTKGQQQPWERISLFEEFVFIPADAKPAPATDEVTFWDLASIVNSAEIYQRYLDRFPTGTFAELAQRKIAAINTDFAYRRKAELFPVLKVTRQAFPDCSADDAYKFYDKIRNELYDLDRQIIYMSLALRLNGSIAKVETGRSIIDFCSSSARARASARSSIMATRMSRRRGRSASRRAS